MNFWRIKSVKNLNEEKFYNIGKKKITDIKPYNSSLIKIENLNSVCDIILKNEEYKKLRGKI